MAECNSHETPTMYPDLSATPSNEQQVGLNKINQIKDCFIAEITERELMSKRLSKYIASFDYCIICNCYWSTSRNGKCKFYSCNFDF